MTYVLCNENCKYVIYDMFVYVLLCIENYRSSYNLNAIFGCRPQLILNILSFSYVFITNIKYDHFAY